MKPSEIPGGYEEAHDWYADQTTSKLEEMKQNLHARVIDAALRYNVVARLLGERAAIEVEPPTDG